MAAGYKTPKTGTDGFAAKIDALQRQIDALRSAAGSQSTTVSDENGDPQVHIGKLQGGGYGIEQVINGLWVPIAQLAGGAKAVTVGGISRSPSGSSDSGWTDQGGEVSFHSYTGTYLLILVAGRTSFFNVLTTMSYVVTGAQTIAASTDRASSVGGSASSPEYPAGNAPLVYAELVTGDPGDMTLEPRFRFETSDDGVVDIGNRTTIVLPF